MAPTKTAPLEIHYGQTAASRSPSPFSEGTSSSSRSSSTWRPETTTAVQGTGVRTSHANSFLATQIPSKSGRVEVINHNQKYYNAEEPSSGERNLINDPRKERRKSRQH